MSLHVVFCRGGVSYEAERERERERERFDVRCLYGVGELALVKGTCATVIEFVSVKCPIGSGH